jgi:thymidylate synthase ThyX
VDAVSAQDAKEALDYKDADRFLTRSGKCTIVHGLPEDVIAMLFGKFSRATGSVRDNLAQMILTGDLVPPLYTGRVDSEKTRKFHERITIGYGHKSVGDHAVVHFALEGVSSIAERDFTSARLIAATSKSTRFVDFSTAKCITPRSWPDDPGAREAYEAHCAELMASYRALVPLAVDAVRAVFPYDPSYGWKSEAGWESATEKRGLDMVRDVLPASVETSFGVTCSATGLREMLDKRQSTWEDDGVSPMNDWQDGEICELAASVRAAASSHLGVLLPPTPRVIPRQPRAQQQWLAIGDHQSRVSARTSVRLVRSPDWGAVQDTCEAPAPELIRRWTYDRGRHLPPDRSAEVPAYVFDVVMPFAIHRDLGRHRMMTQLDSPVDPALGYGRDPVFWMSCRPEAAPLLSRVEMMRAAALIRADQRLSAWAGAVPSSALQYACPLATMVRVRWVVNLRELVHMLGLRTTPQGHPAYRALMQDVANLVKRLDSPVTPLIDAVTNFDYITVGRPG